VSDDEIKAVMACIVTVLTHIITRSNPEIGAFFSAAAPLMVALVVIRRKED
jgi:hypothetical protein